MSVKAYYNLAKPGIVYGNMLTALAGYLFACKFHPNWVSFIAMAIGISLVMGSACVFNNLADRDIDALMERTKKRAFVKGEVSFRSGVAYAILLGVAGFLLISVMVNLLCALIGLIGFIDYALAYTYSKRKTYHATLIGSIAGASPIVGGYVAYSGHLTSTALILGVMMLFWQMPHFYAIAIFREKDYRRAHIPVVSIVKGLKTTVMLMALYTLGFSAASLLLYFDASLNIFYLVVMIILAGVWLFVNLRGLIETKLEVWARKSFFTSLAVMVTMSLIVAVR